MPPPEPCDPDRREPVCDRSVRRAFNPGSGVQGRAVLDVFERQRLGQQPLLHRALDRAFDILPHCAEAQRIRGITTGWETLEKAAEQARIL